jgi:TetR/AcrR family transcriptional regulator, cholesterol catabolism regulator
MDEIKHKILQSAENLFMRYGFKSITMDDVSRELGISKKTLYQYFTDKHDLVSNCITNHLNNTNCSCNNIINENDDAIDAMVKITEFVGNQLKSINPSALYDLKKYFRESWDLLDKNMKSFVYDNIKKNIEQGQKKGYYRKDLKIDIVAAIYVHLINLVIDPEFVGKGQDTRALHLEIIKYHIHAICTAKGQEFFAEKSKHLI